MTDATESGTDVIRRALSSRNRKLNLAIMCRDIGVPSLAVEAFASGNAKLTPEILAGDQDGRCRPEMAKTRGERRRWRRGQTRRHPVPVRQSIGDAKNKKSTFR